jgi:hypothetical protein
MRTIEWTVCVCVEATVSVCPLESSPVEGEWPVAVRCPPLIEEVPHLKTRKSLEKKNMVMGSGGTRNEEILCCRGPAEI